LATAAAVIHRHRQADGDAEGLGQLLVALVDVLAEGHALLTVDEGGPVEQAHGDLAAGLDALGLAGLLGCVELGQHVPGSGDSSRRANSTAPWTRTQPCERWRMARSKAALDGVSCRKMA
jgi:hypothetical protein